MSAIIFLCFLLPTLAYSQLASDCDNNVCKIENNCRCESTENPILSEDPSLVPPQLITITISEPLNQVDYETYWKPLSDLKNPDGSSLGFTFFVTHEFTDYALVHDLYLQGHEIGVHSLTNNQNATYWRVSTMQNLEDELGGEKIIISTFANIPPDSITGVRMPFLQVYGDVAIKAYIASGFSYDNSWPTQQLLLPYTLEYFTWQDPSTIPEFPWDSYPNFWIIPIVNIVGNEADCVGNWLETCVGGSAEDISDWLMDQVRGVRSAPVTLRLSSSWFQKVDNSYEGFMLFVQKALSVKSIFFVTNQEVIEWLRKPVVAGDYARPSYSDRERDCLDLLCPLKFVDQIRYMESCVPCPGQYPWLGNPFGQT